MVGMSMSPTKRTAKWKKKEVLGRIKRFEDAIAKCREYLETGRHADWSRFRPLFTKKFRSEKEVPPHPNWVKNWLLPNLQRALRTNEKCLEILSEKQRADNRIFVSGHF